MKKSLAIIRGDSVRDCPFGLGLKGTQPCKMAGASISHMQALESVSEAQRAAVKEANRKVYRHYSDGTKCPYADSIIESKDVVNCDWGENGAGEKTWAVPPSSVYPSLFTGAWTSGLYAAPISFYVDNYDSRILYAGIYNIYSKTGEINITGKVIEPDPVLVELTKI